MDYRIGRRHLWRDTWNETSGEVDGDFAPDSFSDPMEFGRSTEGPNDAFLALVRRKKTLNFSDLILGLHSSFNDAALTMFLRDAGGCGQSKLQTEVFKALDAVRCFACLPGSRFGLREKSE